MENLFGLWRDVWSDAYTNDFAIEEKLNSNYFMSQDIYICLKDEKDNYFALITLKYFDLSKSYFREDSYFNIWPTDILYKLDQLGSHYMTCGNLTVTKDYRGVKIFNSFSIKDILFGIVRETFLETKVDGVISNTRNARSVNISAYKTGAFALKKNMEYSIKGQSVDLLLWHRDFLGTYESEHLERISKLLYQKAKQINSNTIGGNYVRSYI